MINSLRKIRDLVCYCGVSGEEYRSIKKDAYISNFNVWKYLHILMCLIFAALTLVMFVNRDTTQGYWLYGFMFLYSVGTTLLFFLVLKRDSLAGQLLIYLSMCLLLCCGLRLAVRIPGMMSVAFIVMLAILPAFMIDKPYYMCILLSVATLVFLWHVYAFEDPSVYFGETVNAVVFCLLGIVINFFYNALRVREFIYKRTIEHQRDTDALTGLLNKQAALAQIEKSMAARPYGILLTMDIDYFKSINTRHGHDIGDSILHQLGEFLSAGGSGFISGRFGGDEFMTYLPGEERLDAAISLAQKIIARTNNGIRIPGSDEVIGISIGIAAKEPGETTVATLFKRSDIALYEAKNTGRNRWMSYRPEMSLDGSPENGAF